MLTLRGAETGRAAGQVVSGGGIDAGWPDAMKRELAAVKNPADRLAWEGRWGAVLSGQVADMKRVYKSALRPAFRQSAAALWKPVV